LNKSMIYNEMKESLCHKPRRWLVTGAAGFIGSHLVEHLLLLDQNVVGLDNFSNGKRGNLDQVKEYNTPQKLDRAIRWMLGCHKPKGKGKYGREYAKES